MWQLKEHIKQGCQMAEEILTPGAACNHALPLIIMEHSSMAPDQAALWQSIAQVRFGIVLILANPHQAISLVPAIVQEYFSFLSIMVSTQAVRGRVLMPVIHCRSSSCPRRKGSASWTGGRLYTSTCRACRMSGMPFSHR